MNAVFERRSIRKYTDQPIPKDSIDTLLKAAMSAPSAHNGQPWHFIIVDDRSILNRIAEFHPYAKMLNHAPCAIVVCAEPTSKNDIGFWVQDCSAATENILITAQDIGLGAVWIGVYPNEDMVSHVNTLFNLPDNIVPVSIISIGYPAEHKDPPDRYDESRIHKNKW